MKQTVFSDLHAPAPRPDREPDQRRHAPALDPDGCNPRLGALITEAIGDGWVGRPRPLDAA
jgi:hypothetical protein